MSSILVVTGSVRPNSVNEKIVPLVVSELEAQGADVIVADLKEINLPFFDDPKSPTDPGFAPTNEQVKAWTQMVADADGVLLVTPEYNHTMSPIQLNAVDWIGKEWEGKHIGLVGYGWSGAKLSQTTAREALEVNLKAVIGETTTNLFFMKDLNPDGSLIEEASVKENISATVSELLASV